MVAFDLFVEWLLTRQYQEKEGFAVVEESSNAIKLTLRPVDSCTTIYLPWSINAAISSWYLGSFLESYSFRNFAMKRLFVACARPGHALKLHATVFYHITLHFPEDGQHYLLLFLQDFLIRNWGDDAMFDHADPIWSKLLKDNDMFRDKFVLASSRSLEKRKETPMNINNYLKSPN